jgi:DNA-binding NarL/FixJ family response regulator
MDAIETNQNHRIWKAFLYPDPCLTAPMPDYLSSGSAEDCITTIREMIHAYISKNASVPNLDARVTQLIADRFPHVGDISNSLESNLPFKVM